MKKEDNEKSFRKIRERIDWVSAGYRVAQKQHLKLFRDFCKQYEVKPPITLEAIESFFLMLIDAEYS